MSDLEKALNRKEIARKDCPICGGKGWTGNQGTNEQPCFGPNDDPKGPGCGGSGFIEAEVPFAFDQTRPRSPAELRNLAFGDPIPPPERAGPSAD